MLFKDDGMLPKPWKLQTLFWLWITLGTILFIGIPVWGHESWCSYDVVHKRTHAQQNENTLRAWICEEAKISDVALVYFTYCLVIVGAFGIAGAERTARTLERAYLGFAPYIHAADEISGEMLIKARVYNYGRTNGVIERIYIQASPDIPSGRPVYAGGNIRVVRGTLPPTQEAPLEAPFTFPCPISHHIVSGFGEYTDIFGTPHVSRFCVQVFPTREGVEVVGPPAWNDDY